jgi:TRAP-type C4-dicarboxylate transport system permease small subunit
MAGRNLPKNHSLSGLLALPSAFSAVGAGVLIVLLTFFVTVAVAARYIFKAPILFADAVSGFTMAAMTFLGLAYTMRVGGHISLDLILNHLPPRGKLWLELVTSIVSLVYVVWLGYLSSTMVVESYKMKSTSYEAFLTVPIFPVQLSIPFGLLLLVIEITCLIVGKVRSLRSLSN